MGVISPQCREAGLHNLRSGILELHPRYKDASQLGYRGIHSRIVRLYGRADHCENLECEHPDYHRFEWACLDGEYDDSRETWAMLCVYCHRQLDKQKITPRLK
jgi:hypothetical protein